MPLMLTLFRAIVVVVFGLLVLMVPAGCTVDDRPNADHAYTALFVPAHDDPFFYALERGARIEAERSGVTLKTTEYPHIWDPELQLSVLEESLKEIEQVDLIIIAPTSQTEITEAVQSIAEQGGHDVITVDTYFGDGDYESGSPQFPLAHVGTDNRAGGQAIAEYVADLVGKQGRVYISTTLSDVSSVEDRLAGFEQRVGTFPNMQIVRVDYNYDRRDIAHEQTLEALQDHPDITVIFAANVFSSAGAYQALLDTGMTGAIRIASWDSPEPMIEALQKGHVDVLLAQRPDEMGREAIALWVDYRAGHAPSSASQATEFVIFTQESFQDEEIERYVY